VTAEGEGKDGKPADGKPADGKPADGKPADAKAAPAISPSMNRPPAKAAPAKATPAKATPAEPSLPEPPPWWKTLRADPPAAIRTALGVGLIALIFLLWFVLTRGDVVDRIISPVKLPSPGEVFGSFGKLLDRELTKSIIETLQRVFLGVVLAALVGVGVGVVAAANRGVGSALAPLVIFLRSVPMGALIPLTLLLFADGEKQKTMFIFLAIVPFVFSDTVKAISIVPERYVETAQTLGATNLQIVRKVLVPLALPDIITSLRFQFGLAFGYVMIAEAIAADSGLGFMLNVSEKRGAIERIFALLFVIALLAFVIDVVLRYLQRGAFRWRQDL
jgi:ABC-type nitrate/sulfonate/bicarbonate transport system permease component